MALGLAPDDTIAPTFNPGEGLLGRAVNDKRTLRIDDLPKDYLRITSALGARQAHSLMICPLNVDGEVQGVIELGFLRAVSDRDIELVESLAEPVAVALRTGILRRERENLLKETQAQAESCRRSRRSCARQRRVSRKARNCVNPKRASRPTGRLEQTMCSWKNIPTGWRQHASDLATANATPRTGPWTGRANRYKSEFLANVARAAHAVNSS